MNRTRYALLHETSYIPYKVTKSLFENLEYGSVLSVGCKLLKELGCRISELDKLNPNYIDEENNIIFWYPSKNQKGKHRKEYLKPALLEEMKYYWRHNRRKHDKVLGCKALTFSRYFTRARADLPPEWRLQRDEFKKGRFQHYYVYQLKGFRKIFATTHFYYYLKKTGDADIAALLTKKKMRHSTSEITKVHYIQVSDEVVKDVENYINDMVFEYNVMNVQKKMLDYV